MNHRIVGVAMLLVGLAATVPVQAQTREGASTVLGTVRFFDQATVDAAVRPLASLSSTVTFLRADAAAATADQARPPTVAFEYSDAYQTRARIHKIGSMFMLPLFAAEGVVGQSLYNDPNRNDAKRSAHGILSGAIGGLFAVNSVTGVWNLIEARHDPNGRRLRTVHGILMLAADAGFLATAMLAPASRTRR